MAAKQKHIQRVKQRILEKLKGLDDQEEDHHTVIHEHVSKVKQQATELLQLDDSGQFLARYSRVIQGLDACYNNLELLTADAEDRLNNDDTDGMFIDTFGLDTRSLADESTLLSPGSVAGYDSLLYKEHSDRILTREEESRISTPLPTVDEKLKSFHNTPPPQAKTVTPVRDVVAAMLEQGSDKREDKDSSSSRDVLNSPQASTKSKKSAGAVQTLQPKNSPVKQSIPVRTEICDENKHSVVIPKLYKDSVPNVPIEVKKQLKQKLDPVIESNSSLNTSQFESVDDSSAFEEKVSAASSPKKKSKKSKKKGKSSSSHSDSGVADPSKFNCDLTKTISDKVEDLDLPRVAVNASQRVTVETMEYWTEDIEHNEENGDFDEKVKEIDNFSEKSWERDSGKESKKESSENEQRKVGGGNEKRVDEKKCIEVSANEKKNTLEQHREITNYGDVDSNSANAKENKKAKSDEIKESQKNANSASDDRLDKSLSSKLSVTEGASQEVKENFQQNEKPRITQGTLLEREATPVIVSEVINPWCFYVQRCCTSLNGLMEEICNYMSTVGLTEKPLGNPAEGVICLALYSKDNLYYRALITKIYTGALNQGSMKMPYFKNRSSGSYPCPEDQSRDADCPSVTEVDVIYIDYGNRERVKSCKLRVLPDHLTLLPAQAICCALAEVMPCNKYFEWREEDIFTFNQYVLQKQLECVPVGRSSRKNMPNLVRLFMHAPMPAVAQPALYMTKICIASVLVSQGLAKEVAITDQVGMIMKFIEDMGDFIFTIGSANSPGVEIKELTESPVCGSGVFKTLEGQMKASVALDLQKEVKKTNDTQKEDQKKVDQTHIEDREKVDRSLISPRSECSDTESQKDLIVKTTERSISNEASKETTSNLSEIKEETDIDAANDKAEPAVSICGSMEMLDTMSSVTEPDTSDARSVDTGFHSSDLNLNLDPNPQGQEVMLAHVKSPGLFYVHVVSRQVGNSLDRLMKCLNQQFVKLNKRSLARLSKSLKPALNKMVCAQFLEDNSFYRAVIKQLPPEKNAGEKSKGKYHVFYVDFGDDQWVPASRLFPLPEPFVYFPPLVLKCSLAYIKPLSGEKDAVDANWSEKATETFVSLATFEKRLLMHVVHGTLSADRKGELVGEDNTSVGVLLIDSSDAEEVCINMDLIRLGVAELDASNAAVEKQEVPEVSENMTGWNPMEEDYFSIRNSYNIDVDDPGVATTGYKAQDERRICKFFNRDSCWRGERCPWRHVKSDSGVTMDQETLYFVYNNQETLLPDVHCWVAMEISTILTPGHFYAILPMGNRSLDGTDSTKESPEAFGELKDTETLDDLQASLNEEYSAKSRHEGTLILRAPGEIVAARYHQDQQWYRARVLQSTEEKVKVFYLDFGNTEWISARDTFEIQPQFLHLPFQAIECFLHNVEPVGGEDTWSKESKSGFRELVDGRTLVGHVKSKSWNGCIWIELYDTTGDDDINIADVMVAKGFAVRTQTFTETSSDAGASIKSDVNKSDGKSSVKMIPG